MELPVTSEKCFYMDAHATELAIMLRTTGGDETEDEEQQPRLKIIQLKGLSPYSDAHSVATFIIQSIPLIPFDHLARLEELVIHLQKRQSLALKKESMSSPLLLTSEERPITEKIDAYIDLLYEEGESKQKGVCSISELVHSMPVIKLSEITKNDQLMGALARTLKEDARLNFELAIQLARLFYRLTQFKPFHQSLSHWKIGLLNLNLIEHEMRRKEIWHQQIQGMDNGQEKRKWEYAMRKQEQLIIVCLQILMNLADDIRTENKMLRKGLMPLLFKALEHSTSSQMVLIIVKFLWKLSRFAANQRLIANSPNTIEHLISLLSPPSLISPALIRFPLFSLLFNCSFEFICRRRMVQSGLVSLLAPHFYKNDIVIALMYQLSITEDAKAMVAFTDCIPLLLNMILQGGSNKREILVKSLLLNIVLEERNAQLLCGTDGRGLDALMEGSLNREVPDILVLKIVRNIAAHDGQTQEMFNKWMPQLLKNAIENIYPPHSDDNSLLHIFGLECLAIAVQIYEASWIELDQQYEIIHFTVKILSEKQHRIGNMKNNKSRLNGRANANDDLILQAILLSGTLVKHSLEMAEQVEEHILQLLVINLNGYQNDEEIVLQTIFVYICMLSYEGEFAKRLCSYQYVINETEENAAHTPSLIELLLNFMYHKNPRLRTLCNKALQLLSENNPFCHLRILEARFNWHNSQWLKVIEQPDLDPLLHMYYKNDDMSDANNAIPAEFMLNSDDLLSS